MSLLSASFLGGNMEGIFNTTEEYLTINGATTAATVFNKKGILLRVVVEKSSTAGALTVKDIDGVATGLNPDTTVKGTLAYGLKMGNGCVVDASDTSLLQILFTHEDA